MKYFFILAILFSTPALAYVGPGPGLSMLGSALGLLAGVGVALLVVIIYPLRLLWLKIKKKSAATNAEKSTDKTS